MIVQKLSKKLFRYREKKSKQYSKCTKRTIIRHKETTLEQKYKDIPKFRGGRKARCKIKSICKCQIKADSCDLLILAEALNRGETCQI